MILAVGRRAATPVGMTLSKMFLNGEVTVEVKHHLYSDVHVLELAGRIDSHSASTLRSELTQLINLRPANIVVDLEHVSFIDSSGLAILVQGLRTCRERGGSLCLSNPQHPVRLIFELTRLDRAIDIFPNHTEAIASFGAVV